MSEHNTDKATEMKMVVTLKSGVQIVADVEEFSTGSDQVFGQLRRLRWTTTNQPGTVISWLDMNEVTAIHADLGYDNNGETDASNTTAD